MAVRIEDAGFEIRDLIAWVYGSGFPKSLDISKAIDREAGAERKKIPVGDPVKRMIPGADQDKTGSWIKDNGREYQPGVEIPATEAAKQWQGRGTALKPAFEPVTMARKPFASTVAANVLEHGTGGLNVDGCRVPSEDVLPKMNGRAILGGSSDGWDRPWKNSEEGLARRQAAADKAIEKANELGRWPANFIHDGSDEATGLLGDAARFFYTAKASKADRDAGCEAMELRRIAKLGGSDNERNDLDPVSERFRTQPGRNHHPTVKPTDLMRYLCRLVTPSGGIVLDPFTGSGSTGKAAILEGFRFIGIEREAEYIEIARARIQREAEKPRQPTLFD
jgi:site-specific DNA-methyltransferase (adenine-specific)